MNGAKLTMPYELCSKMATTSPMPLSNHVTSYFVSKTVTTPQTDTRHTQTKQAPVARRDGAQDWSIEDVIHHLASSTETIIVRVAGASFAVHRTLLCHYSPYYRAALSGSYLESDQGLQPIDYLTKESYSVFIGWLHSGMIPAGPQTLRTLGDLIRLYIYADEYDIPAFRKTLLIQLFDLLEPCRHSGMPRSGTRAIILPSNAQIEFLCDRLPSFAPLSRLVIEAFACYWHPRMDVGSDEQREMLPPGFLTAVMMRQAELREEPKTRCQYGCPPGYRIRLARFMEFDSGERVDSPMAGCSPVTTPP